MVKVHVSRIPNFLSAMDVRVANRRRLNEVWHCVVANCGFVENEGSFHLVYSMTCGSVPLHT